MSYHSCFSVPNSALDVVVIDGSKSMQGVLRSMLLALKVKRIRVFEAAEDAVHAMLRDPPNLILSEWTLGKIGGQQLLRMIRARFMHPLCFVPVIVVSAQATRGVVERAMAAGAHLFVVKPVAPAVLAARIAWLQRDRRQFLLGHGGSYEIEGVAEKLQVQRERADVWRRAASRQMERASMAPRGQSQPPADPTQAERWQAFLKSRRPASRKPSVKAPDETLSAMPKAIPYAALRDKLARTE